MNESILSLTYYLKISFKTDTLAVID